LIWVARQVCSSTVLITRNSFSIFQDKQEDKALLNKSRTDLKYKYVFFSDMQPTRWAKKRPQIPCQGKCSPPSRYFHPRRFSTALSYKFLSFSRALCMCSCKFLTMQQLRKALYASCVRSLTCHHLSPVTVSDYLNGSRYRPNQFRDILTGWRK
jgi:hypothetical protein